MDDNLYDEFGVYIGPDLDEDEVYSEDDNGREATEGFDSGRFEQQDSSRMDTDDVPPVSRAVVLHEDKKYYPDAEELYGPNVEVTVQEEDTQHISEPIVKPLDERRFDHVERSEEVQTKESVWHASSFNKSFLNGLMSVPDLIRNVGFIGHLNHGKTILIDSLVHQTHESRLKLDRNERFTDVRFDEQERGLSIKAKPVSLVLPNGKDKSYLINIMDTPGHPNFVDEVSAGLRVCDGVVLVLDVVEGVTSHVKSLLKQACMERLEIVVVLNKIDRLILELKIPPQDAYFKIRHVLDELNDCLEAYPQLSEDAVSDYQINQSQEQGKTNGSSYMVKRRISPELGNVVFASGENGWSFSLLQFSRIYCQTHSMKPGSEHQFARRLWGDIYFNPQTRGFSTKNVLVDNDDPDNSTTLPRTFVQFILEPLYKIYGQVIGEDNDTLYKTLDEIGVSVTKEEMKLDVRPLLKLILMRFFGNHSGLVDMIVQHISNPVKAARRKIENIWLGDVILNDKKALVSHSLLNADPAGPLMIQITKLYPNADRSAFYAFGRVFSGTIKLGEKLKIFGENFIENEEDVKIEHMTGLYTYNSRYMIPQTSIAAGNWVLIEGIDETIVKTATITTQIQSPLLTQLDPEFTTLKIFKPLKIPTLPIIKIAVEPLNPSDLPKLIEGLRKVNKTFPILETRVEESGERIILGTGELYLDTVMHDLTKVFTDIHIKIAEPVVTFSETVVETSTIKCFADTPNKANRLTFIAEPLEKGLAEDIENGKLSIQQNYQGKPAILEPHMRTFLQTTYGWDIMSARNIWAFGPDSNGPNVLLNDTLPTEVPQASLNPVRDYIIRGFNWATKEGPLCEEPIRGVKFKMMNATIASEAPLRTGTHIIPTARRVAYSAFLTATPRLMEPIYAVDILAPPNCVAAIDNVLARRRGHIVNEKLHAGTPFTSIKAYIPCIDSFGFETDLRSHTQGQAFCLSTFDHWAVVPGNPLDSSIVLKPLEASAPYQLARDFMVKTRRRKGLSEDITVSKFFDEELLAHVQSADIDLFQS